MVLCVHSAAEARSLRRLDTHVLRVMPHSERVYPLCDGGEAGEGGSVRVSVRLIQRDPFGSNTEIFVVTHAQPDAHSRLGVVVDQCVPGRVEDLRFGDEVICVVEAYGMDMPSHAGSMHLDL